MLNLENVDNIYFKLDLELLGDCYSKEKFIKYFNSVKKYFSTEKVFIKVPRYGYDVSNIINIIKNHGEPFVEIVIIIAGFMSHHELKFMEEKYKDFKRVSFIPLIENQYSFTNIMLGYDKYNEVVIGTNDLTNVYGFKKENLEETIKELLIKDHNIKLYWGGFSKERIKGTYGQISTRYFMVENKNKMDEKYLLGLFNEIEKIYKEIFKN